MQHEQTIEIENLDFACQDWVQSEPDAGIDVIHNGKLIIWVR
jgi:hypothetical protein